MANKDKVFIFDSQEQMCKIVKYNYINTIVVGDEYKSCLLYTSDAADD